MSRKPPPFAVLDFETNAAKYGVKLRAFLAGFFDGKLYEYFWSNDEQKVLRWASKKISRFPGITYAHNGGRFDFLGFLFRTEPELLYGQRARLIGSRIVAMKYGAGEIRDSMAILPAAQAAGSDKLEIFDFTVFNASKRDRHRAIILERVKTDCHGLYGMVKVFLDRHGFGPLTAASAAMRHAKELGYDFPRLSEHQDNLFRSFYYGGRVEAKWTGAEKGVFKLYDIKSAYPHAMLSPHCAANLFEFIANPAEVLDSDFVAFEGFARGCFPQRTEKGMRYPEASGEFLVTGWEYNEAKRLGRLGEHRVKYVERPTALSDFRRYVDHWFAVKEEAERNGDKAGRLIAKIMLNALYGKYAQRPDRWRDYVFVSDKQILTPALEKKGWTEEYIDEENHFAVWSMPSPRPPTYYNVATAASITGFVRARIMRAMSEAKGIYCDTDSILTRGSLETSPGLGGWGLEVEGDFFACAGKKLYALRVLPTYAKDKYEAKKKGYYWQKRPLRVRGKFLAGGRAWKIASKGCRMTPGEMVRVSLGGEVKTFNAFPTFSIHAGEKFITRTIRKTA